MNQPIRRLALTVLTAFAVLVGTVSYLQVIAGPRYRDDPRNARVAAGISGRERGGIITSDGVVVARSTADPDDPLVFLREYPEAELYAHVVGYSTLLFGSAGMENAASGPLSSDRDATISGILTAIGGGDLRAHGIRLTIDDRLQRAAFSALGDQTGAVVVLDTATGAVLAMVSTPSFDPNTLLGAAAGPAGDALTDDARQPLLNRAINEVYAPGSTFKVVTAAAALETGIAGAATQFPDVQELPLPGSTATIRNFDGGPCANGDTVTLLEAFVRSCNTIFGLIGMDLGSEPFVARAEAFGVNETIGLELEVTVSRFPPFGDDLPVAAQSAIGQRDLRVTPLQMAMVAATVANDGEVMQPYLVAEEFDADAEVVKSTEPTIWRRAVSPATAGVLTAMMEEVVTRGTGTRAAVPGVRIAGKTGTAETDTGPPDAWFIGFGPIEPGEGESTIAIAVLVESGGEVGESATGGTVAAPIAQEVFAAWLGLPTE